MKPRYIAAIEIGSSSIRGVVAAVAADQTLRILAAEETDSGDAVRYGRVQNAREVSARVADIIKRLENHPQVMPGRIVKVYLGAGGRSLRTCPASATVNLGGDTEITAPVLERLRKEARNSLPLECDVLAVMPRRYTVDNAEVKKVVGAYGHAVGGEFTIVTASRENRRALDHVSLGSDDAPIAREYGTRLQALGDMALGDSDRQLGCMLLDFGAETTTAAIYKDGALQAAVTLPMGSANITRDLSTGLSITADAAENIKCTRGRAVAERAVLQGVDDQSREIINYISARTGEILANVLAWVDTTGYKTTDLTAGIILTGGGSRLQGFAEMAEAMCKVKTRPATLDGAVLLPKDTDPLSYYDAISLVALAARCNDCDCLELPADTTPAGVTADEPASAPVQKTNAAAPRPAYTGQPRQRRPELDDDDPSLLRDDPDEQPDNINRDDEIDFNTPPAGDADQAREGLVKRLLNWFAPPRAEDLSEDE